MKFTLNSFLCSVLILSAFGFGRQKQPSDSPADDRFVGQWKLNIEKSSLPPEDETILIEPQGNMVRISFNVRVDSDTKLAFWTVTDMKGTKSAVTQADGKAMEEQRVTRESPDSFTIESGMFHTIERYAVSADGKTLTQTEVSSGIVAGKLENGVMKRRVRILVFDKSSLKPKK